MSNDPTSKKKTKDAVKGGMTKGITKLDKVRKLVPLVGTTSSFSSKNSMKGLSKFITQVRDTATQRRKRKRWIMNLRIFERILLKIQK